MLFGFVYLYQQDVDYFICTTQRYIKSVCRKLSVIAKCYTFAYTALCAVIGIHPPL